ncbi:MAG TPA: hypothetical protein VNF06_03010 [Candidatus Aquilonibacter sp.]|nr:hypothetical protein [Candidatus Aquilonibacter sp.]
MSVQFKSKAVLAAEAQCEHACSNLENARPHGLDRTAFYSMVKVANDSEIKITPLNNTEKGILLAERVRMEIKSVIEEDALVKTIMANYINQNLPSSSILENKLLKNQSELAKINESLVNTESFLSLIGDKLALIRV